MTSEQYAKIMSMIGQGQTARSATERCGVPYYTFMGWKKRERMRAGKPPGKPGRKPRQNGFRPALRPVEIGNYLSALIAVARKLGHSTQEIALAALETR